MCNVNGNKIKCTDGGITTQETVDALSSAGIIAV